MSVMRGAANSGAKVTQFFKYASQGTDASDAQVTWYIEKNWVDINVTDKLGCNAAHYAVAKNRGDLIVWLAEHGIDINLQNKRGRTPLHTVAEKGRPLLVNTLLEHGAAPSLEIFDQDGFLPIHVAAANCELHALKAFIRAGVDLSTLSQGGQTCLEVAGTGHRNMHLLGAVKAVARGVGTPTTSSGSSDLDKQSVRSESQASVGGKAMLYALSAMDDRSPTPGGQDTAPTRDLSEPPESMVLGLHLARQLVPMVSRKPEFVEAAPHLKDKLETLEPLMKSLHRSLSRRVPPEDSAPHIQPVISTLMELWHVVDKASKPMSGLKKLTRSLAGNSGKAASEVGRLDEKLHDSLERMTQQLLVPHAPSAQQVDTAASNVSSTIGSVTSNISSAPSSNGSSSMIFPPMPIRIGGASGVPPPQLTNPPQGDALVKVGMETQVTAIADLLKLPHSCGVVLVHGPLGVGKTATCKEAFQRICKTLHGVPTLWVDGLAPGMGERELVAVQREIGIKLAGQKVEPQTLEEGRVVLRVLLGGQRIVLAMDGLSGTQLQDILPTDIATFLGQGSILLLSSRNPHAAAPLLAPADRTILDYPVTPLPDEMAAGLFCRRAFNTPWAAPEHAPMVATVVAQCGGLPLALEVTAHAWRQHNRPPELFGGFEQGAANRLFAMLHEAIDGLNEEEGEALLDIAVFFVGAPWAAVASYCGEEVLDGLERSGLVQKGGRDEVVVGAVVAEFCRVVQSKVPGEERVVVVHAADVEPALDEGVRGAWFRGVDPHLEDPPPHPVDHVVLLLDACPPPPPTLPAAFPNLTWLSCGGRAPAALGPPVALEPLALPALRVLSLDHLPVSLLSLQALPLLHHLTLSRLPHLTAIVGLPHLPHLSHIVLRDCPLLTSLHNLATVPFLKSLALHHCPALAPPSPPSAAPAARGNTHLLALNNAAFSRFRTLEELLVEGAWDSPYLSLAECPALRRIAVRRLPRVEVLAVLGCMGVQELEVAGCGSLTKLLGVGQLAGLQALRLEELPRSAGVLDIGRCERLLQVVVRKCPGLKLHPGVEWLKSAHSVLLD